MAVLTKSCSSSNCAGVQCISDFSFGITYENRDSSTMWSFIVCEVGSKDTGGCK